MQAGLTESQKTRYTDFLGPIIDNNFRQRPSAGPAFAQMTYQLTDEVAANTARSSSGAPTFPSCSSGGRPTRTFMSPSPTTCGPRSGTLPFMFLTQGTGRRSTQPPRSLAEHSNLRAFPRKLRSILSKLPPLPISRSTDPANLLASQRPASSPGSSGYPG
jgi:hypothetical protein